MDPKENAPNNASGVANEQDNVITPDAPQATTAPEIPSGTGSPAPIANPISSPDSSTTRASELPDESAAVSPTPTENIVQPASVQPMSPVENAPAFVAPAVAATSVPARSKKKKFIIAAIVVAVILVLLGGSAAAYYGVILPNQPQRIAQDALVNTFDPDKIKSRKMEGEVKFTGGEVSKSISSVTYEYTEGSNEAIDLKVSLNTMVTKVGLDVRSLDRKSIYARVSGLDGLDKLLATMGASSSAEANVYMAQLAPLLTKINNNWYIFDESLLKQVGISNLLEASSGLSEREAKKVGEIYKKHQFLNINKKLEDQQIHGNESYHVQATIDKDKLKGFLTELKAANIKALELEQKDIDEIAKIDFSKYPLDLWVTKKDRYISQIATAFEQDGTKYDLRLALFDINKSVNIEKPANAKSVLELMSEVAPLYGGGVMGASTSSPLQMLSQ